MSAHEKIVGHSKDFLMSSIYGARKENLFPVLLHTVLTSSLQIGICLVRISQLLNYQKHSLGIWEDAVLPPDSTQIAIVIAVWNVDVM